MPLKSQDSDVLPGLVPGQTVWVFIVVDLILARINNKLPGLILERRVEWDGLCEFTVEIYGVNGETVQRVVGPEALQVRA